MFLITYQVGLLKDMWELEEMKIVNSTHFFSPRIINNS